MAEKQRALILGDGDMAAHCYLDFGHELDVRIEGFVQDHDPGNSGRTLEGLPVYTPEQAAPLVRTHKVFSVMGAGLRGRFVERVEALGFEPVTVIHPGAIVSPHCEIGPGSFLYPAVGVSARAKIGRHVLILRTTVVGHGAVIGDYSTISSGCMISGNLTIGRECYLGMGAVLTGRIKVGDRALVGAGTVVVRDVPPGVKVVGNPARVIGERDLS
jgi:sugar O-acyltransferase (sialic acid O-acetyltransferase NeuD family)